MRHAGRIVDVAKGAAALTATGAFIAGVPLGLWQLVGWPLSHTIPTWTQVTDALGTSYVPDEVLVNALAVVCWLAWAQLVASLAVETIAAIRGRPARRVPLAGPLQTAAAHLVATITLLAALAGPRPAAALGPPPPLPIAELAVTDAPTPARDLTTAIPALAEPDPPPMAAAEPAPLPTYTVERHDDLWSIAERHLADPYRWTDIWDLNRSRTMNDGAVFRDPDLIHPGWNLQLPHDATGLTDPRPAPQPPPGEQTPTAEAAGPDHDEPASAREAPANEQGQGNGTRATPRHAEEGLSSSASETPTPSATSDAAGASTTPQPCPPDTPADHSAAHATATPPPAATRGPAPVAPDPSDPVLPAAGNDLPTTGDDQMVELPSGTVVGLSFAAGVSAGLAAARLHRRRRRTPDDPQPGIDHTEPLADDTLRRLRRTDLMHHAPAEPSVGPEDANGPHDQSHVAVRPAGTVTAGARDGQPVTLDLTEAGGIALTGPAATDTARALTADFLASARPGRTGVVVADHALADRLLPGVEPFPGLDLLDGLEAALSRLEVELIHRTRLLDTTDTPDFAALTRDYPEEPAPALLLVTDPPDPRLHDRLTAVLNLGQRLGIAALVLGHSVDVPTITVASGGQVDAIEPAGELQALAGARLSTLDAEDARRLLAVIAAGRGNEREQDQPNGDAEPFPTAPPARDQPPEPARKPITVTLLGPARIEAAGKEIRTGLRSKARELLAFFLLHPRGATLEAAIDTLWPDADPTRGVERFRTVLANLRTTLRDTASLDAAAVIDHLGERYQADTDLIDCDVWRFQAALTDSTNAADAPSAIAALDRAVAAYSGDLVDGAFYEWAEPAREDLRRRAIDAAARLAQLREQAGNLDAALAALEHAIRIDPYTEELYRRIIRLQAHLGRPGAARHTYRLLETRLADLDVEPDATTERLFRDVLHAASAAHPDEATTAVVAGGPRDPV